MISPTAPRPRAVTVGEGLAVLVARPGPLEDSETFERTAGGAEANVATVLAQLDIAAGWISRVGDDGFGRYLVQHLVFMGADEALAVFGTGDPAELRAPFPQPEHLIVKNDAHTVTGFHGQERLDVPALRLAVVEKIGAGDAFAGGFLAGLLRGLGHQERIRLGHLCAAAALTGHGDIARLPPLHRLEELLEVDAAEWARLEVASELAERIA